jgi:hypothetical protein
MQLPLTVLSDLCNFLFRTQPNGYTEAAMAYIKAKSAAGAGTGVGASAPASSAATSPAAGFSAASQARIGSAAAAGGSPAQAAQVKPPPLPAKGGTALDDGDMEELRAMAADRA